MASYRVVTQSGIRTLANGKHWPYGALVTDLLLSPRLINALLAEGAIEPMEALPEPSDPMQTIKGIKGDHVANLRAAGYETIEAVAAATPEQLIVVPGIGRSTAGKLIDAAREKIGE